MEGPEVVVAQVDQILQGWVKLLHDALDRRARDASHGGGKKDRWTQAPRPGRLTLTFGVTRILAPSYRGLRSIFWEPVPSQGSLTASLCCMSTPRRLGPP